jgi:hypothetical protein
MTTLKQRAFPYVPFFSVALFMTIMASVMVVAYTRRSGKMGMDMEQLHLKRVATAVERVVEK